MSAALSDQPHDGADLVGTFHRIAGIGPPYEVVSIAAPGYVTIVMLESGETVEYRVSDARSDPVA